MEKSAYSLILSDSVIREIDRLAYQNNTNRSGMVNQILAEYVSVLTPEARISKVFSAVRDMLLTETGLQSMTSPRDSYLTYRSALTYKYNPTVRYQVLFSRSHEERLGEIRVYMRTQNPMLLRALHAFFLTWHRTESLLGISGEAVLENGRYIRYISGRSYSQMREEGLAERIARYIRTLDRALKTYFEIGPETEASDLAVYDIYKNALYEGELF